MKRRGTTLGRKSQCWWLSVFRFIHWIGHCAEFHEILRGTFSYIHISLNPFGICEIPACSQTHLGSVPSAGNWRFSLLHFWPVFYEIALNTAVAKLSEFLNMHWTFFGPCWCQWLPLVADICSMWKWDPANKAVKNTMCCSANIHAMFTGRRKHPWEHKYHFQLLQLLGYRAGCISPSSHHPQRGNPWKIHCSLLKEPNDIYIWIRTIVHSIIFLYQANVH